MDIVIRSKLYDTYCILLDEVPTNIPAGVMWWWTPCKPSTPEFKTYWICFKNLVDAENYGGHVDDVTGE